MKKKYHAYGIGNALVDMEFVVTDEFLERMKIDKGVMTLIDQQRQKGLIAALEVEPVKRSCGGSAANSIIAIQQFGGQCYYSCKVGNDETGEFYHQDLKKEGVDSNLQGVLLDEGATGQCLVMVTPDAERTMNTYLGITERVSVRELNLEALIQSEYVYLEGYLVTSPTGKEAAIKAREVAQEAGCRVALTFSDPNMVEFFKPGLLDMLGQSVDLIFCNEKEALLWANTEDLQAAIEALKACSKSFAITLGAKGALVYDGQALLTIDPKAIKAVDTNGAGDMFAGAFIYGLTHGYSYVEAGHLASCSAATLVTEFGARLSKQQHVELLENCHLIVESSRDVW